MRSLRPFGLITLLLVLAGSSNALAQDGSTYRVILYIAEGGGPSEVTLTRLQEIWGQGESTARLQSLLQSGQLQELRAANVEPGRDATAFQLGNVTVRVTGVYKEPRRDAMFLRVEVDGGPEALVKELISRFDETIVLAYPLAEGNRSVVALLVPTGSGN